MPQFASSTSLRCQDLARAASGLFSVSVGTPPLQSGVFSGHQDLSLISEASRSEGSGWTQAHWALCPLRTEPKEGSPLGAQGGTHCRYRPSSCWLQRDQWKRWKAACTKGAMILPSRTSSPQRLPCPSCSMPSLYGDQGSLAGPLPECPDPAMSPPLNQEGISNNHRGYLGASLLRSTLTRVLKPVLLCEEDSYQASFIVSPRRATIS